MSIESDADRTAYVTEFGESANFTVGAVDWDANGIFDNEFVDVDGVESRQPVLMCRLYDIYDPASARDGTGAGPIASRATSVQVTAGGYDIVEVQDDGVGMVLLVLEKQ